MATIADLQAQFVDLQSTMTMVQQSLSLVENQIKVLTEAEEFDVFVENEIAPIFGASTAKNIISALRRCRTNGNNYIYFIPVYQWKSIHGDIEKRQILKLISAVYRVKYLPNNSNSTSLRSEIKYAKECPHCGALAASFYNRLVQEGKI